MSSDAQTRPDSPQATRTSRLVVSRSEALWPRPICARCRLPPFARPSHSAGTDCGSCTISDSGEECGNLSPPPHSIPHPPPPPPHIPNNHPQPNHPTPPPPDTPSTPMKPVVRCSLDQATLDVGTWPFLQAYAAPPPAVEPQRGAPHKPAARGLWAIGGWRRSAMTMQRCQCNCRSRTRRAPDERRLEQSQRYPPPTPPPPPSPPRYQKKYGHVTATS